MAFQSVPETAEAVIQMGLQNRIVSNTFYFRKVGGYDQGDIDALAVLVDSWAELDYMELLSNQVAYFGTNVRGLEELNDLESTSTAGASTGAVVQNPNPANVSFCVSRRSGLTGRSARGRVYIPGVPVTALDTNENFVTTSYRDNAVAQLNELSPSAIAEGWTEVIVSRFSNKVKREQGVTFIITEYLATDLRIDSQRGRLG